MRHLIMLLALAVVGGLLMSSQAWAADQYQYKYTDKNMETAQTGEQLQQPSQVQEQGYFRTWVQSQDRVHAVQLDRMQIREMQRLLNLRGYPVSSYESDSIGRETTAAIRNFQQQEGLLVTGVPNQETLRALAPSSAQHEFFGLAPEFWLPDE